MIQQEELHIKQFTTGVTFYIFSDTIYNNLPESPSEYEGPFLSYVLFNDQNEIYSLNYFTGSTIWTRNNHNNYIPIGELGWNYQTGYTIVKTVASNLSQENIDSMTSLMLSRLSDPTRPGTPPSASAATNYVFYKKELIDDFYIDLKIERGYNSLDTLKINNNLVNSFPEQNSPTGVVFGRLTAIQKLKGEFGENIRIPLVNVPIGIFNSSDEFPSIFSTDENGDRLSLNIKEAANPNQYFNNYSYFSDYNQYLKSADSFSAVPAQYKYVTLTNENGEFVLYDIPVGQQTAIFEVDLFKQGLTKDEIALNFFPFPGTEDANIDSTPSFVYKQFPVDVVPAWGLGQTGYTSLDININLDLRKWATFYVAPISVSGYQLESPELSTLGSALNVEVRDMSRIGFPTTSLPIVQIPNITEKDTSQALLWLNEFSQLTNVIKFYKNGFNAFKVRANMYDPNAYRTNSDGFPVINPYNKGVWLAGYQFLMYFNNKSSIFRSTGFQRDWNLGVGRDNFHLNRGIESGTKNSETPPDFQFPYNKPWTIDFPEKYSIPHKPTQLNFDRTNPATRLRDSSNRAYLEQPLYLDGDMVGLAVNEASVNSQGVGGFGLQYSFNSAFYFGNRFAQEITDKSIYKYESRVFWGEKYSNGYEPSNPGFPVQPGVSRVLGGEKYQRVECGYGYWLKPDGWPPIAIDSYGDLIFTESLRPTDVLSSTSGPGELNVGDSNGRLVVKAQNIFIDIYNIGERDIALALDNEATFSEGGLDIYRVIDSNSFLPLGDPVVPTFTRFNFGRLYVQRGPIVVGNELRSGYKNAQNDLADEFFSVVDGSGHADFVYQNYLIFSIKNLGVIPVQIPNGPILMPNDPPFEIDAYSFGLDNLSLVLPANSNFDFINSKYTKSHYGFELKNIRLGKRSGEAFTDSNNSVPYNTTIYGSNFTDSTTFKQPDYAQVGFAYNADVTPYNYYLHTIIGNAKTNYNKNQEKFEPNVSGGYSGTGDKWKNDAKVRGLVLAVKDKEGNSEVRRPYFTEYDLNADYVTGFPGAVAFDDSEFSMPIQIRYTEE
jgi:hypothetical protein